MRVMDTHESKPYQLGRCPECRAGFVSVESRIVDEHRTADWSRGVSELIAADYEIVKTCANGHVTVEFDHRSFVPPREREVSVEAEGEPYVGPVVVKYARHFSEYEDSYETFEEAWESHWWSSGQGEEYTIHYAKPDGTILWEMPNPFDGWIRRSPDAPPIPEEDE